MGEFDNKNDIILLDGAAIRKGISIICQANAITTDAGWSAHIDSRTDPQILVMLRNYFKTLVKIG